tara:strand:- start:2008 stop:2481 length:474 start_codon:yes stop_codon:yes gene_type:complete
MTLQKQKRKIKDTIRLIAFLLLANSSNADELLFKFKSPSFSGINSSSHYLTIENQENTRKNAIQEKIESDADDIEREKQNTTMARFIRNYESRVMAQISRQLVDALFSENPSEQGKLELEGNTIEYLVEADIITLTITNNETGEVTIIQTPSNSFTF